MNILKKILFLICLINFYFLINCTQKGKKGDLIVLPPEDIINISNAQKTKALITGERKNVDVGNVKRDVWTIIYTDSQGNIHSTIIKKLEKTKNKPGDSINIYYDNSNEISLPIYEEQFKKLNP